MHSTMLPENLAILKRFLENHINDPPGNTVTLKHLRKLDEACRYDAASSYNYLFAELMVIKHAVARGRVVTIDSHPSQALDSIDTFMQWAIGRYPAFKRAGYHDLYIDPVELVWNIDS